MRTTNCDFVVVGAPPPDVFWTIASRKRRSLTTRQRLLQRGCSGPGIAGNLGDWGEESYGEDKLPGVVMRSSMGWLLASGQGRAGNARLSAHRRPRPLAQILCVRATGIGVARQMNVGADLALLGGGGDTTAIDTPTSAGGYLRLRLTLCRRAILEGIQFLSAASRLLHPSVMAHVAIASLHRLGESATPADQDRNPTTGRSLT
jgi:hypothetical protein